MNEYQPSTILPPGQGTSKFGGTQSRIIMGGVNCQKLGANMLPGLLIAGEQYGIVTDGETVARNASANPDVIEIQNAWSLMSDEAVLNSAVAVVDYDPETLAYDVESGVLTGVTTVAFEAGTAYWCKEIVTIGDAQMYVYEPTVAGRDVREVYEAVQPVSVAAEAYNVGKVQLAQAITSKGVETSPTETYPEMAEKVNAISQETYEIDGGEMYAKQLFGSLETPNYWNLYDVLAQLLSDGRLVNYGGILLAEYYRGYDSIALSGAGAGGAYVVSDKDGDGNFIMYTDDTTHVWDTEFDGKGNRWVAYCFADAGHSFSITNTDTCPRSIFIGRHVGVIECIVKGRISEIVVPDGNLLDDFRTWTGASINVEPQNFAGKVVLRGIGNHSSGCLLFNLPNIESAYIQAEKITNYVINGAGSSNISTLSCLIVECPDISGNLIAAGRNGMFRSLKEIIIKTNTINCDMAYLTQDDLIVLQDVIIAEIESGQFLWRSWSQHTVKYVYIGYSENDKTKSVQVAGASFVNCTDLELKNGWNKPLDTHISSNYMSSLTEENMYAHILQRLKQDEADCGVGVTITLGSTNLAKLTSEESVQLLDDLTNIYGYTLA